MITGDRDADMAELHRLYRHETRRVRKLVSQGLPSLRERCAAARFFAQAEALR